MTPFNPQRFQRRQFLRTISGLAAGAYASVLARADDLPRNTNPRAIFGDSAEPDWKQRLTLTVGPKKADLVGATDRVIQAAVDYVAYLRRANDATDEPFVEDSFEFASCYELGDVEERAGGGGNRQTLMDPNVAGEEVTGAMSPDAGMAAGAIVEREDIDGGIAVPGQELP